MRNRIHTPLLLGTVRNILNVLLRDMVCEGSIPKGYIPCIGKACILGTVLRVVSLIRSMERLQSLLKPIGSGEL